MPRGSRAARFVWVLATLLCASVGTRTADAQATPIMTLSEVRAGQAGVGYTVVRGTRPDEFQAEILGVLHDAFPGLDLIVARLGGLDLERSGVVAGMSGSPVFVDDRLVGAVAYRLVDFGHEAIAGIVPIESMLALDTGSGSTLRTGSVADLLAAASRLLRGTGGILPAEITAPARLPGGIGRIATPIGLTGFEPGLTASLRPLFDELGWAPMAGGVTGTSVRAPGELAAGGAIGVQLVRGDLNVTATGTITYVDGDRVLALGHPFMQGGEVDFPLVTAEVITVLSSQAASQKLTAVGREVIGAVRQDRLPGIMAKLGETPAMIPVTLQLAGASSGRRVAFEVVEDPILTPLYLFFGLVNAVQSLEAIYGAGTIDFAARVRLGDDHEDVELRGLFADRSQAVVLLAGWLSGLFGSVQENSFEAIRVLGIDAEARFLEGVREVELQRLWYARRAVRAGETARLRAVLRPHRGDPFVQEIRVPIPPDSPAGRIRITVGSAASHLDVLAAAGAGGREPRDLAGVVQRLNTAPRSDVLYVAATARATGAKVAGTPLPTMPPSVMEMLESGASAADVVRLERRLVYQAGIEVGHVVSGSASVEIEVVRR